MADLLTNQGVVRSLLAEINVKPQKRLGQNFLVDPHVVAEIRDQLQAKNPDVVVEIGPGLGALTQAAIDVCPCVIAVEIDKRLARGLAERLGDPAHLEVRNCDVLSFDFTDEFSGKSVLVLGSLPYRITTPILKHLIAHREAISSAHLITQWEVAEKIAHSPGKNGSALGVFVNSYGDVIMRRRIRKGSFFPVPEVESAHWEISFLQTPRFKSAEHAFFLVVRTLYRNRRKMARRALQDLLPANLIQAVLADADIEGSMRGETLSFEELDRLAQACAPHLAAIEDSDTNA